MKNVKILKAVQYLLLVLITTSIILLTIAKKEQIIINILYILLGIVCGTVLFSTLYTKKQKHIEWLEEKVKLSNSIAYRVKYAGEKCFTEIPVGIIVYDSNSLIQWANSYAQEVFNSPLVNRKISSINKNLDIISKTTDEFTTPIYGNEYKITVDKKYNIIFIQDITQLQNLHKKYDMRILATGIINLDNFEEALSSLDAQTKAMHVSDIIGLLSDWGSKFGLYIQGYSEKQFIMLLDKEQLNAISNDNFSVIDDVNRYCHTVGLKISISIGVACVDEQINQVMEKTNDMLNLALKRGGNQATVYCDDKVKYFGGKEIGSETRIPVYVRLKTKDLCDTILKSDNVLVMTHTNSDTDAFGACIGAYKICSALDKKCSIVLDDELCDETVKEVLYDIRSEHIGMNDYFVSPSKALSEMTNNTLLILVDVQYEGALVCPKLYKKAKSVAVIDHHRSNNNSISNYVYMYNKTTSSSTCELLVEMFDHMQNDINLSDIEANLMLLGIIVDTNNFIYRTSSQTFSVISKLQLYGAQMQIAQNYLREDKETYLRRIQTLQKIEEYEDYGICVIDGIATRPFIAKIADNIITLSQVKAGFCIGLIADNKVAISARSFQYNVQVLMEELGGGGHFNNAAAQLNNITLEEAKEKLLNVLKKDERVGEDKMKIILIKDVKGKGKSGDVIDIPTGHANYLIKSKFAIFASKDNLDEYKKKSEQEKLDAQKHLEEMRKLKEFLDENPVKIGVKVGAEGKVFGSVSPKQIVDEYYSQYKIQLDKRKIISDKNLTELGTHKIPIQLHKDVSGIITLYIVEK